MLAQLLDRVAAVLQDARVAVDVGDRAAARRGVRVRGVVGHQAEVLLVGLDLAQVHRPHGPVLDRQLVGLAGAVVRHREGRLARGAVAGWLTRHIATGGGLRLGGHRLLLSAVSGALPPIMRQPRARSRGRAGGALRRAAVVGLRCDARMRAGEAGAGSPWGPRRGERGSFVRGWWGARGRGRGPMPPSCPGAVSGRLPHRPAHDQEQRHDRDLQEDHQPDEGPSVHRWRSYTAGASVQAPDLDDPAPSTTAASSAAQLQGRAAELRHRVQFARCARRSPRPSAARCARCRTPRR